MSIHFLIVDDNEECRKTVIEYLTSFGFAKFTEAANGAEAMMRLEKESSIGFMITDWDMPIINGPTLVKNLRTHYKNQSLPILITTAPIEDEAEKVALAAKYRVDGYLLKPFRLQALQEKVAAILVARGIKVPLP